MKKKVFIIGSLDHRDKLEESNIENPSIVAHREAGKLICDLECFPERSVSWRFNAQNGIVTIEFQLRNAEFLAIGDASDGVSNKGGSNTQEE